MRKAFFIDFDGTITNVDTCRAMVQAFARAGWEEINKRWENKEISTAECAQQTFALFHTTPEQIRNLLLNIEIDPYFIDFCAWCQDKSYPIFILSDGYDLNIKTILNKFRLQIPYYANKLIYDGSFNIKCPYLNDDCGNCGTCKTHLMQELKGENLAVYIGDGYSDTCPASQADMVFAKGTLYQYCIQQGIPAQRYQNFGHILASLQKEIV
ncbi:MAG: MtnX-like HAD-IB family phosphatase [Syntrophomonadaceae bacterium]|jgi:2-hydroxy-3-keto-5-methylthiopentenyl-1-phosphate phosphatase